MGSFKCVGQRIEFFIESYTKTAIIRSYSVDFHGNTSFDTNKGIVEESQVIKYF